MASISTQHQPTSSRLCGSGGALAERNVIGSSFPLFLSHVAAIIYLSATPFYSAGDDFCFCFDFVRLCCFSAHHRLPRFYRNFHHSEHRHRHLKTSDNGCPRAIRELQRVSAAKQDQGVKLTCSIRVGVFSCLTNAYAIVAVGGSENFYRSVETPIPTQLS